MVKNDYIANPVEYVPVISLQAAKNHLRVDDDMTIDDDLIESYIQAATVAAENYMSRSIYQRDFVMECDSFDTIEFSANLDNDSVTSVEYYPADSTVKETLDPTKYKIQKSSTVGCWLLKFLEKPALSDRDDAVVITVKQGLVADAGTVDLVPKPIIQAILLTLSEYYEIRENRSEVPATAAMALLRPYRKW